MALPAQRKQRPTGTLAPDATTRWTNVSTPAKASITHPKTPQQNRVLYRIYIGYRWLLSAVFLLLMITPSARDLVGSLHPVQYALTSAVFLLSNIALLATLNRDLHHSHTFLVLLFSVDVTCIILLADASGGMSSGLPLLLAITVASSAILISNRTLATLVAALAVIAILSDTVRLISINEQTINDLLPAGLLGLLLFVVSTLVQMIASRLGRAEALARERTSDLYSLQRLNELIVQNMQTGILLVDRDGRVRVMNQAATALLRSERPGSVEQGRSLREYSDTLNERLQEFRSRGTQSRTPFRIESDGREVVPRFRALDAGAGPSFEETLVFLEDYTPVAQYAQSLKLGSLGRLTASIAHEVRNPLGAISHATQLLAESPGLSGEDTRFTRIILDHCRRVNSIVDNVLQLSRRQSVDAEPLALGPWLEDFAHELRDHQGLDEDRCRLAIDSDPGPVAIDPEHLHQVVGNLCDNALTHGQRDDGRPIRLLLRATRDDRGLPTLDIEDDGQPIDPARIEEIFEPFVSSRHGGTGLGLFLARELCEANGARLRYRAGNGGNCFRIQLRPADPGLGKHATGASA